MSFSKVSFLTGKEDNLNNVPLKEGQLLFTIGNHNSIYMDCIDYENNDTLNRIELNTNYLSTSGGTLTDNLSIQKVTNNIVTDEDSQNPRITFTNGTNAQRISLIYCDYDSYQAPDSLTLVGNQANSYFIAPNIKATTGFHGSLNGNASSADMLNNKYSSRQASMNFNTTSMNGITYTVATSATTTGKPPADSVVLTLPWDTATGYGGQIAIKNGSTPHLYLRGSGNSSDNTNVWDDSWLTVLDSNNYTGYTVTKTGSGASGSWGISVTGSSASCAGNAATATTLQTARTINGTSFNGSANITTSNWGTARNISIADNDSTNTGTAVSVNGSAAVTLKLPSTIKASLTGNASTATKLATARTINGTSFDGSANITTANWGTARNISIASSDGTGAGTAVSVNGSANATLKLPGTIKATLSGNASTATKLATARTISLTGSVTGSGSFDGSGNLSIATTTNHNHDSVYLKLSGGTITGNLTSQKASPRIGVKSTGGKLKDICLTVGADNINIGLFSDYLYNTYKNTANLNLHSYLLVMNDTPLTSGICLPYSGYATTTSAASANITSSGWLRRSSSSSRRYKTDIKPLLEEQVESLYNLPVRTFKYKNEYLNSSDIRYQKDIPGFIAEEVAECLPIAVDYNEDGEIEMWNWQILIPCLLKLIQGLKQEVSSLKEEFSQFKDF